MRVIFMGTPAFSVPCLEILQQMGHEVVAVYSQPPRPSGRGHHLMKSPVHQAAEAAGIPVFTPKSLRSAEAQECFRSHEADLAVVIAYGLILPKEILETPRYGCVNVHASLLPRWRGAAPIQRAIEAGDVETGITIMKMDEGLDTGPMLLKKSLFLTQETTGESLFEALMALGAAALKEAIPGYISGEITLQSQPSEGVTYAKKLEKDESDLDWTLSAHVLERTIRAFSPWPGTRCHHHETILKIHSASVVTKPDGPASSPGDIIVTEESITVTCGEGYLQLSILQRPGGKPLATADFLKGYALSSGDRLT